MKRTRTFYRLVNGEGGFSLPRHLQATEPIWRTYYLDPKTGRIDTHKNRLGAGPFPTARATTRTAAAMAFLSHRRCLNTENISQQGSAIPKEQEP
jgi:hypothetical protein